MVKARPLATETEENPVPTEAFQRIGGPFAGQSELQPFSAEIPFRPGPRQCGQSSAVAGIAVESAASKTAAHTRGRPSRVKSTPAGISLLLRMGLQIRDCLLQLLLAGGIVGERLG